VSLPAVTPRLYSSDEVEYFSYLRSLYFDRDVSFENEYQYFYDHKIAESAAFHETFLERATAAGRRVNYATIGSAILWLPFYAIADAYVRITGSAEANGFSRPYIAAVAYGSAFYAFLAVLLSLRLARLLIRPATARPDRSDPASLVAALAVWLGTPLLFYMYVAPPFSHACSAFAVAVFLNLWLHVRRQWSAGGAFLLGISAAVMTMVREQDAFVALGPAVDFVWWAASTARRALPYRTLPSTIGPRTPDPSRRMPGALEGAAGLSGFLLGYAPQLLAYDALNGYPGPAEHVSRKMYWYSPHGLEVIFSPEHGFFFWTPLALVALAGLFTIRDRRIATCLLLAFLSQIYIAGCVASWTVAGAFGQRRFVCLTALLVVGLAALWDFLRTHAAQASARRLRTAAVVTAALCVWWNVALMAQFATRLMDRQRLEPARNAYHAFVTLPRMAPSLAWRYLVDRESFYDSRNGEAHR
jgi:hypothetical protein